MQFPWVIIYPHDQQNAFQIHILRKGDILLNLLEFQSKILKKKEFLDVKTIPTTPSYYLVWKSLKVKHPF